MTFNKYIFRCNELFTYVVLPKFQQAVITYAYLSMIFSKFYQMTFKWNKVWFQENAIYTFFIYLNQTQTTSYIEILVTISIK